MRSTDLTFSDIRQLGRAAVAIRTFGRILDSSCIGGAASQKDLGPREAFRVHVGLVTLWNRGQGKKIWLVSCLGQHAITCRADEREPIVAVGRQGLRTDQGF